MTERPPKISIPIKRIERLIKLAKDNDLAVLKCGHIEIVPQPKQPAIGSGMSMYESMLKGAKNKDGKPLTQREQEDALLFGPNGVIDEQ